jgi:hypothetical protein
MKKPNGFEIWNRNFFNAKRFFETKGNIKTKSKLKDKWFNDFKKDLEGIEVNLRKQVLEEMFSYIRFEYLKEIEIEIPHWLKTSSAHTEKDKESVECFINYLKIKINH